MSAQEIITAALAAAAAVCELAASWRPNMKWRARFKPFVVLTLLAFYLSAAQTARGMFVASLLLCFLGDMLLIPRKTFFAGGVAFFTAHLFFAAVFIGCARPVRIVALLLLPATAYALVAVFVTARLRSHARRSTVRVSVAYLVAVSAMSLAAFLLALSQKSAAGWLIYAGSVFFVASDSVLLIRNYRKDIAIPRVYFIVMFTYIAALALMTLGMVMI